MKPEEAVPVNYDDKALQLSLQQLETRALDKAGHDAGKHQFVGQQVVGSKHAVRFREVHCQPPELLIRKPAWQFCRGGTC